MATIENYRNLLRVNKLRLDDELEIQAETQERIGAEVARLNTRAIEAKDELARVEARLLEDIRDRDPKLTVDQVKGQVTRHQERRQAWSAYQQTREVYELWSNLLESWKTKGFKLGDLGHLYAADYFSIKTITRPEGERARRLDGADEASREALREASNSAPQRRTRSQL